MCEREKGPICLSEFFDQGGRFVVLSVEGEEVGLAGINVWVVWSITPLPPFQGGVTHFGDDAA